MTVRSRVIMYHVSISIAILSMAVYHISQMLTPRGVNLPISLSSSVAMALTAFLLYLMPASRGILAEVRQVDWASRLLAVSIVGLAVAFLLVCRPGWNIGLEAVLANVAASLIPGAGGTVRFQGHAQLDLPRRGRNLPRRQSQVELEALKADAYESHSTV